MEEKLFTTQKHCYTSCGAYIQKHFYKHWFLQRSLMEYKCVGHINIKRVNTCLTSSLRKTSLLLYKLLTMRSMRRLTCHVNKIKCQIPKIQKTFQHLIHCPDSLMLALPLLDTQTSQMVSRMNQMQQLLTQICNPKKAHFLI